MAVRLPNDTERAAVIGSTGSGKTQFGIWLLSSRPWHLKPWVIFDFKGDDLIADLPAKEIPITGAPPKKPGLYVVRPLPHQVAEVEAFLWKCWEQENIGIYIDEGYMVGGNGKSAAFRALLTQGRSKHIPMIILSQRPVWMDRFVFSEANYYAVFRLTDRRDLDTVQSMVNVDINQRLAPYHCYWYDVGGDAASVFSPVPARDAIVAVFKSRVRRAKLRAV